MRAASVRELHRRTQRPDAAAQASKHFAAEVQQHFGVHVSEQGQSREPREQQGSRATPAHRRRSCARGRTFAAMNIYETFYQVRVGRCASSIPLLDG